MFFKNYGQGEQTVLCTCHAVMFCFFFKTRRTGAEVSNLAFTSRLRFIAPCSSRHALACSLTVFVFVTFVVASFRPH